MISREEVLNLASLARLSLSDAEVEALQKDISSILDYVGQVSAAKAPASLEDTRERSAEALAAPHNILRDDVVRSAGDPLAAKEESLRAAFPTREANFNVVRKIIQKDE